MPTDAINEAHQRYQQLMQAYDAHMWSGRITPHEFLKHYRHHSRQHHQELARLHNHHPDHMRGPVHLAHRLEALHEHPHVTNPDGSLNHTNLRQLEAELRQTHTYEEGKMMDIAHGINKQRYHGLSAYHQVHDDYEAWMESWCEQYGIQLHQLEGEITHLLKLPQQQAMAYLHEHPEIIDFERDKQKDWDKRPQGYMHAHFLGHHDRVLKSHGVHGY